MAAFDSLHSEGKFLDAIDRLATAHEHYAAAVLALSAAHAAFAQAYDTHVRTAGTRLTVERLRAEQRVKELDALMLALQTLIERTAPDKPA